MSSKQKRRERLIQAAARYGKEGALILPRLYAGCAGFEDMQQRIEQGRHKALLVVVDDKATEVWRHGVLVEVLK